MKSEAVVKVVSAGHDAGDVADFFVDDRPIPITGVEKRRGLNVVVIDPGQGTVQLARSYDVWGDPAKQNTQLASDLSAIPQGHVVLVALKDSGMENLNAVALEALEECGASIVEDKPGFRQGYALIGRKGERALAEERGSNMLMVDATLPFGVRAR